MVRFIFVLLFAFSFNAYAQKTFTLDELKQSGVDFKDLFSSPNGECTKYSCSYSLWGQIDQKSVRDVKAFLAKVPNEYVTVDVFFSSPGGDIDAAMEIGRLLRKRRVVTSATGWQCSSSCVLAYVGGVRRQAPKSEPVFGIHTPFPTSTADVSQEAAQKRFVDIGNRIKSYLREMNIPESLYDEMLRYPTTQMHYLTANELSQFLLVGIDPVEQDRRDSDQARRLGLDKITYLQRRAQSDAKCDKHLGRGSIDELNRYRACSDAIMGAR